MSRELNEIVKDLEKNGAKRDRLDRNYWKNSEKLTDEFETLMKELDEA